MKLFNYFSSNLASIRPKPLMGLFLVLLTTMSYAQAVTSLSGQYSCMMNRNFGGLEQAKIGVDGIASNGIGYLDFNSRSAEFSIVAIKDYGLSTADQFRLTAQSSNFTVTAGPITNSFLITLPSQLTYIEDTSLGLPIGKTFTISLYAMPVNNGNTLMLQEISAPGDGAPATEVCNKI